MKRKKNFKGRNSVIGRDVTCSLQKRSSASQRTPKTTSRGRLLLGFLQSHDHAAPQRDTSASQPLKRNQDVEAWIRSIENLVKPPTDEAYIQAARANCRGPAELIINSPLFDFIRDWETFKASLRTKFRGTYTSADFYKVLYENRMSSVQAPMDFYLQLEGHVYQGYRDHREAIGDPSELVRRVFLSGIPSWLRDFLAVKDDCSPMQLAETAQRIWNSRNGIRHESATRHQSPNEFRLDDDRDHRHYPDRPPRARDLYACPIAAQVDRVKTPQLIPPRDPWCSFHGTATHNTSECRAASYVTSLRETDPILPETSPATVAEDLGTWLDNVPFRVASKEKLPVQLAEFQKGAVTSTSTQTETTMSQIAMLSSLGLSGRPLVGLNINGKTTLCFIDTGSEATLIKPSAVAMIVSHQKLQHRTSTKILRGVTGQPLQVSTEVTLHFQMAEDSVIVHQASVVDVSFPGDILIGMDLLRRLDFTFSSEASTGNATITLQGHKFSVVYTDAESLKICCIKPLSPTEDATPLSQMSLSHQLDILKQSYFPSPSPPRTQDLERQRNNSCIDTKRKASHSTTKACNPLPLRVSASFVSFSRGKYWERKASSFEKLLVIEPLAGGRRGLFGY
ncbi:hypothetical protein C7M84_017974 [Penaeus vannamei]|uniref:Retropepsins domain-containing protein n=1 Tax=Penaeus vannamei TaxID=6689 RepID=A0A3R7PZ51_PENVA|nr:hypothetical protein C7M84_017974 [Penaeus vannamei]